MNNSNIRRRYNLNRSFAMTTRNLFDATSDKVFETLELK